MLGLLDGDILPYEFGAAKDEDGNDLPLNLTLARVYERIDKIKERSGVEKMDVYMTGKGNFREGLATILPYKGNRPSEKSRWWAAIRHELIHNLNATVVEGMEADDAVSIIQYQSEEDTVILSRDKDLNMVPGYHYGWEAGLCKEKPLWKQTKIGGLRCFYKQLLTGDKVDNILGLFGVGAKSALVSAIDKLDTEEDMYLHVRDKYVDRFGSYADQFLLENGRLLWMLQEEGQLWVPPETVTQQDEQGL